MAKNWWAKPGHSSCEHFGNPPLNLALLAAAVTGVQVGAAIVASRFVVADVPPPTLALLRYAIGFCCLLPFALPSVFKLFRAPAQEGQAPPAIKHIAKREWLAMATLGLVGFIGVSSGIGYFWWLYALGALLLGETLDRWALAALVCIACGLWLATRLPTSQRSGQHEQMTG